MSHIWKGWWGWKIASWPTQASKNRSWYDVFCFQFCLSYCLIVNSYCNFLVGHFIGKVFLIFFERARWEGFRVSIWKEEARLTEIRVDVPLSTNDQVMDHSKMAHQHWTLVTWHRYPALHGWAKQTEPASLWGELLYGFRIGRGAVGHQRFMQVLFNHIYDIYI